MLRTFMEGKGVVHFELPKDEEGGASERKEAAEVEDLEYERADGTKKLRIYFGDVNDIRVSFK